MQRLIPVRRCKRWPRGFVSCVNMTTVQQFVENRQPRMARIRLDECICQPSAGGPIEPRYYRLEIRLILRPQGARLEEKLNLGREIWNSLSTAPDRARQRPFDPPIATINPRIMFCVIEHQFQVPLRAECRPTPQ